MLHGHRWENLSEQKELLQVASVTLEAISKRFGEVVAVSNMHLEVKDKEFLVLVGPSGCGKSTTLRMIAGLEEITEGSLFIGDRLVNDVPPKDRDIAMVFQSYALYPHMSVYDNLAFGLRLRRTPKKEIDRRVRETAEMLGIGELLNRKPRQLSGGQRQRVALGRAIVRDPAVFLMDEPLSNLDAKLRVTTRAELIKLHRRLETTTIYVTHDQVEAMTMGHRIAVMRDGVLQQLDSPQNIYDHPSNMFVAGFIGSPAMNFQEATLTGDADEMWVQTSGFKLRWPPDKAAALAKTESDKIYFGWRPEDMFDPRFRPAALDVTEGNGLMARVDVVETLGSEMYVYCLAGDIDFVARLDPRAEAIVGRDIQMVVDVENCHAFDMRTQESIF